MAVPTTQNAVLAATVKRLIDTIQGLTDSTCFVSLFPVPPGPLPPADVFLTVSPAGGQFDPHWHDGGGEYQTFENASVYVTIFSRVKLDRSGRDDQKLTHIPRGLLEWKRIVLRCLSGQYLTDADGNALLVNAMLPHTADAAESSEDYTHLRLVFTTDFLWDLTS